MTEDDTKKRVQEESVPNEDTGSKKPKVIDSRDKGIALIKPEFIISATESVSYDDDAAESARESGETSEGGKGAKGKGKKNKGQNKNRELKQKKWEQIRLCPSLFDPEDETKKCLFGAEACRYSHDVDAYLVSKPTDLTGCCPIFRELGYCPNGLKCRWLASHFDSETKKLIRDPEKYGTSDGKPKPNNGEVNGLTSAQKASLQKKKYEFPKSEEYLPYLDSLVSKNDPNNDADKAKINADGESSSSTYIEAPFKPSEKKRLNLQGKKILSPLTTVGNLPYRRLMKTLGAEVTYSEMAFGLPLVQGTNAEWALPKAHESEYPGFGVQIATAKHWQACKSAEAIYNLTSHVSEINLNCGCPIDLLYRQGQGSALLDNPSRLVRLLKGMNAVSGDIPVTVKIRMGTRDNHPTAANLVKRVLQEGDAGAITLHGRSRQQRYTKEADWNYISEIGKIVQDFNEDEKENKEASDKEKVYLVGNGDIFNYQDWYRAVDDEGIDAGMVARGALIKPWIFEEIEARQYLDKSATERLAYLEKYANYAITHWGSDDFGINTARRFMCEFMSFTHRYIPIGILERLPAKLNERPPMWKGRNELETLLGSSDYKDWIKISEMFLGPASADFQFTPKHKSNSYEK